MRQLSEIAKSEILAEPLRSRAAKRAFVSAFSRVAGMLGFSGGQKQFAVRADNPALAAAFTVLLQELDKNAFGYDIQNNAFIFKGTDADDFLDALSIFIIDKKTRETHYAARIAPEFKSEAAALGSLRGLFVGAGSISVAGGFHLEFSFNNGFLACDCIELLARFGQEGKMIMRNKKHVIYLKKAELISDLLTLLGAKDAALKVVDESASRETSRLINRRLNCDLSNINKQIAFAAEQVVVIQYLVDNNLLKNADAKLIDTANMRLAHPDASLTEFANLLSISKTGARHRLDKLMALYLMQNL